MVDSRADLTVDSKAVQRVNEKVETTAETMAETTVVELVDASGPHLAVRMESQLVASKVGKSVDQKAASWAAGLDVQKAEVMVAQLAAQWAG